MTEARDREYWYEWLVGSIDDYCVSGSPVKAFPSLVSEITRTETLAEALGMYIAELRPREANEFGHGVGLCFSRGSKSLVEIRALELLLGIARTCRSTQVSEYLVEVLPRLRLYEADDDLMSQSITLDIVNTLYALSARGDKSAARTARLLLEYDELCCEVAVMLLLVLCKCFPDRLGEHLETPGLRQLLMKQMSMYNADGAVGISTARTIYAIVGFDGFYSAIPKLDATVTTSPRDYELWRRDHPDNWLIAGMFNKEEGPLRLQPESIDRLSICSTEHPHLCRPLDESIALRDSNDQPLSSLDDEDIGSESVVTEEERLVSNWFYEKAGIAPKRNNEKILDVA